MNLLPKQKKDEIRKDIFLKFMFAVLAIFSFWAGVMFVLIYNIVFYLDAQITALEEGISAERASQSAKVYQEVEKQISELNTTLLLVDKIRGKGFINSADMLRKVGSTIGEGIFLTNLSYQGDVLTISGHADARDQVLKLKSVLEGGSFCASLTLPIITKEADVDFTLVCSFANDTEKANQDTSHTPPVTDDKE